MNKERTILYLFSINAIIYIASGFYTPFLSAYYAQKGIDAEKIGILLMIGPCVVLLTQRFWAKISDRTGKRKEVLLVTIVGSGFSMLLYYLGNSFLCMFFATVVVTSFTTAVIPLSDAILIARSLKEGYSYSIIRLGGTLGYAVMTICAGMYLKTRPQMQFVFAFFAYMILFCFCIGLKEERNGQIVINEVVQENEQNRIFKNRDVYIVLGLAFVSQMGLSFYTGFIGPYILEKGYTQSTIGVINSISALSEVPVLFYINRMLRKHGTIKILFLSCFLMGIRILLPIRSGIIGIVLAQLLQGVTYIGVGIMREIQVQKLTKDNFGKYGEFLDLLDESELKKKSIFQEGFFADVVALEFNQGNQPTISVCHVKKQSENIISFLEAHQYACEGLLPLDGDVIIFVGIMDSDFRTESIEAFYVPKGTFVKLNPLIVHGTQYPVDKEDVHIVCMLPGRTFKNDMLSRRLETGEQIRITRGYKK